VGTSAHAEGQLWLTGGGAYRSHLQLDTTGTLTLLHIGGTAQSIAPWNLHLSGAYFFNSFLGVNLEARGELFYATQKGTTPVPQPGFEFTPAAAARWSPLSWLSVEGQLGWAFQLRSQIKGGPSEQLTVFTGPSFGVALGLVPSPLFSAQLFFRAQPVAFALTTAEGFRAQVFSGGAQFSVGALRLGVVQVGVAVTIELTNSHLVTLTGGGRQFAARVGVGLSLQRAPEQVVVVPEPIVAARVTLSGHAQGADGAPLAGVVVSLDAENPVQTDEKGTFGFPEVAPGSHVLRARKEGFTAATQDVMVTATPTAVTLTLVAPNGPGRITGVVRSKEGPIDRAALNAGLVTAVSDAEGHYVLEGVGPGPVKVLVRSSDFADAEEIAQVPPDAEASLDFTLVPKTSEVRATLRGLIRAKSGETVQATVRIVELKLKLAVKADGRFSAEVPSGKYTVIIEARGYLTQTKTVEVSGGDQAIFHAELEKTR
jgi:hypothetical protein